MDAVKRRLGPGVDILGMFCKKCGEKVPLFSRFCKKCGAAVAKAAPEQKKKKIIGFLIWLGMFIALVPVMYYFASHAANARDYTFRDNLLGATIIAFFSAFGLYLVYKLIVFGIRRPVWGLSILAAILLLAGSGYFSYLRQDYERLPEALALIQGNLAEVAATKEIGDFLADKKTPPKQYTWQEVKDISAIMAGQIDSSGANRHLAEYKEAGVIWAEKIRDAAADQKAWKDLPAAPDNFALTLKESDVEKLFYNSLAKIFELTQLGSDAVRRKDRETMRYIAAKLLVQEHWLAGLANYKKAGIFSKLISPVYAEENRPFEIKWESLRVRGAVLALKIAAAEYYQNKATGEDWKKTAEKWAEIVAESDLAPQVLTELIKNAEKQLPPEQQFIKEWAEAVARADLASQVLTKLINGAEKQPPPQVKAFRDFCSARSGALGGINRTNKWLQTIEDGFYCRYEEDGQKCWKFLSYSGSIGAGGESDCEEKNVLPKATGPNSALPGGQAESTPSPQTSPAPTAAKPAASKPPASAPDPLHDLGEPTGTAAPKIEFILSQSNFNATVGEHFSYSFCAPALARSSDICTASATNPKFGLPPYSFTLESGVGFLPYGLTLNLNGLLEGMPHSDAVGSRTVGICVKDTGGFSVCRRITINVEPAPEPPPAPAESTVPQLAITSNQCVQIGTYEDGSPKRIIETTGTAGGAVGTKLYPSSSYKLVEDCGAWSPVDDRTCERKDGQPYQTSWKIQLPELPSGDMTNITASWFSPVGIYNAKQETVKQYCSN